MDELYATRFGGIGRLYGVEPLSRLADAHVCIIGIGGVGSWAVEALARSGAGHLTLIDMDDICVTNTNRQLHTTAQSVGLQKVDVMAERARAIHPECHVEAISDFVMADTMASLITPRFDVVLDAIDDLRNKCLLIAHCRANGIDVVTVGGAGGRRDPTKVRTADLTQSTHDGLLRKVRRQLKREHGFDEDGPWDIPCVFSTEHQLFPTSDGGVCHTPERGSALTLDCHSGFGTASFVTGAYGFAASALVMARLTGTSL